MRARGYRGGDGNPEFVEHRIVNVYFCCKDIHCTALAIVDRSMELNVTRERRGNAEVNGELNERVSGASSVQ